MNDCSIISGFPSVGKSSLMSGLTGTESVAAACELIRTFEASYSRTLTIPYCGVLNRRVHDPYNVRSEQPHSVGALKMLNFPCSM